MIKIQKIILHFYFTDLFILAVLRFELRNLFGHTSSLKKIILQNKRNRRRRIWVRNG
jgi:hypothetical protein